ncbi:hypothetical protein MOQ72_28475 [Saccharopolyspora sp. K220]|uniref:hypothetical protein n=1 Tax=Saccharopolyspora soli TaxID=2926618 RepID=UPI001F589456|nr:hypothetical protein [Saccharopolyspora soli]MCI2421380.1 hypothetical protein [Saccharopolyspora soli]
MTSSTNGPPIPPRPRPRSADSTSSLDNDKLRRDNHELREHLDLAAANIQRLTLDNYRPRQQLEAATKVIRIDRRSTPR